MAQLSVGIARPDIRRFVLQTVIVFIAYYLAGKLGQATSEIRSSNIGPVWPAYGVALAAVVLCGYRIWPVLLAAAFFVAAQGSVPLPTAFGQASGAVTAAVTGSFLLRRFGFHPSMSRLRDVLLLIMLGALVSALVSSTSGVVVLAASGLQGYSGIAREWFIYWMGDATGVLLVTPLVLAGPRLVGLMRPLRAAEFGGLVILLILASLVVFELPVRVPALLLLPFVIWASIRFGIGGSALATLIVAAIATVATALGRGPFSQNTTFLNAMLLDVFFATIAVSGLMLASLIAEREKAEADREALIREQATMEARLRLAAIVESSEDAIVGQDVDGIITDWNAGAARLYAYGASEAIGSAFSDLVQSAMGKADLDFTKSSDLVSKHETVHVKKDGTRIEVSVTMSPIHDTAGHIIGISAIVHDITERQQAANALRESEDKLRLILDSAAEGIFGIDVEGRCTFCNPASLRILGYDRADALLGKQMHDLIHHSHPDGTPHTAGECPHLRNVLQADHGLHMEDEVLWRRDGSSFHAQLWTQLQSEDGRVIGAVVCFNDITQRLQSEANTAVLRDELAHLSRVGMLGALTGTLAHEINQPLAAASINAEAALRLLDARPLPLQDLREVLADIRDDNQRAGEVLQHIRTLLKKHPARLEEVDLNPTVNDVVKLIKSNAVRHGISVDIELSPWMRPILGDRVQVQQVLLNLLMNACDAVQHNESNRRRVSAKTVPHKETMVIEVADQGPGISEEELPHIFQPFFTTKREGLGLGLSICQSIVAAHGGTLDAARNPGGGMTFSVMFPISQSAPLVDREGVAARQTDTSS
jgi:two-component system sensor kinase FixL